MNSKEYFNSFPESEQEEILEIGITTYNMIYSNVISKEEMIRGISAITEYVAQTRFSDFNRILFDRDKDGKKIAKLPNSLVRA